MRQVHARAYVEWRAPMPKHAIAPACRHLGPHESSADHWILIGEYASPIDKRPIIAIANLASTNSKVTGDSGIATAGIYILSADTDPRELVRSGNDSSICGNCPLQSGAGCYVRTDHGPLMAWRRYIAGEYRPYDVHAFRGLFVRLGEYGDPAFIPIRTVAAIVAASAGHTGYTHAWTYRPRAYARYLMASVSHETGAARARAMGYRTFRVRAADDPIMPREFACPAAAESGHRLTCTQCGACNGAGARATRASVTIIAHGARRRAATLAGTKDQ